MVIVLRFVFISLQWQFTAYYLQAACLFRKMFQANSDEDFEKVRSRKLCLRIIEYVVYTMFLACILVCLLIDLRGAETSFRLVYFSFHSILWIAIALITICSRRHINIHSKQVERLGIRTNSKVIKLYAVLWVSCVVVNIGLIAFMEPLR